MKGYVVLLLVVSLILLMMPVMVLDKPITSETASDVVERSMISVKHTDTDETSEISLHDLTLYETAAMMPADAPAEAIKAQAIAAYTQFCYQRMTKEDGAAAVISTALPFPEGYTQEYWKGQWGDAFDSNIAGFREAVSEVFGKCITYDGQPIMAVSHIMNTGTTEDASVLWESSVPYLKAVASPGDALATDQITTIDVPLDEARKKVAALVGDSVPEDAATWFGDIQKTQAGTVKTIGVCSKTVTGSEVQAQFSLPSAAFEIAVQSDSLSFTVHGRGHFVGMSVTGACAMAKDGHTYEEILKHYYAEVSIA